MALTVLSDADVRSLLHSLKREDVCRFQENLAEALHEYSTGTQDMGACSMNQPMRTVLSSGDNTTLFMPARTSTSTGCKIVSLNGGRAPPANANKSEPSLPAAAAASSSASTASVSGVSSSGVSSTSSAHSSSSSTTTTTTTTTTRSGSMGTLASSLSTQASLTSSSQSTTPKGCLTLLSPSGAPVAFINAEELTAFRTALAATFLLNKRARVHSIVVFGAGKQAYWHIRLALLLRGAEIHHVRIVNRTFEGAEPLLKRIYTADEWRELRGANRKIDFSVLSRDFGEYDRLLKEHVRDADAIFCCTPSTRPLFPAEYLTNNEGRKKGRYLSLIGSYKPHMLEVDPAVLRQAVEPDHKHHHHRHAEKGGVVVVDGIEACMKEAGEVIQAGLSGEQLVELGELVMVKKAVMKEIELGGQGEKGLKKWLMEGNVIYKSVGLGLMDLTVAEDLVDVAIDKGVGVRVEEF